MAKKKIYLPVIQPRKYQIPCWKAYHEGAKNIIISLPRRFGKDVTSLSIAVDYAMKNPKSSVVIMCPTVQWAKRIYAKGGQDIVTIHPITGEVIRRKGSLIDVCIPKELMASRNATEGIYTLVNGSTITLMGSSEGSFIGVRINFLIISETASHKKSIFGLLSPVMQESNGVTIFNGTVTNDTNFFWSWIENNRTLPNWCVHYLTLADTENGYYLPPKDENGKRDLVINSHLEGKISPYTGKVYENIYDRVEAGDSISMVKREYLNIPMDIEDGSFYSEIISSLRSQYRIGDHIEWNPDEYVHCALDLGRNDATVITWFQVDMRTKAITFIEAYGNTGEEIGHYIDVIRSKPYKQGMAFAPHDATRKSMVSSMDILDLARTEYDFTFHKLNRSKSTLSDINVCRNVLAKSKFIYTPCRELLKHLDSYHAKPDGSPKHDSASDWADSMRYAILAVTRGLINEQSVRSFLNPRSNPKSVEIQRQSNKRYVNRQEVTSLHL